jgi:hypothetical protein
VRAHLVQLDVFCYLKARFGEPNGFQNFLRRDDSDNIIHWEYHLRSGKVDIQIMGAGREIHFVIRENLSDQQWHDLIVRIKNDFRRVAREKSRVLRTLEKWVIFPNKFVQVASVCADLHSTMTDNVGGFETFRPRSAQGNERPTRRIKVAKRLSARANKLYGATIQLSLLTPVLAEAFINMLILMLCKLELRNDRRALDSFLRSHIHTKVFSLPQHCRGFVRSIDESTPGYKEFKRVMDRRNHAIHGNIDPVRERLETVYFERKRPIFAEAGDHLGKFYEMMEKQYQPERVLRDYEATYAFLVEIMNSLEEDLQDAFWRILEDRYPGYDVKRQITGVLFPDYIATSYMAGMRYNDELKVDWEA